jgi:hypothetical protein
MPITWGKPFFVSLSKKLIAYFVRRESLLLQDPNSRFTQDLYKYYLRAAGQLMSKYFKKVSQWTYIYEDISLFVPDEDLDIAGARLKLLNTKQRKKAKARENRKY